MDRTHVLAVNGAVRELLRAAARTVGLCSEMGMDVGYPIEARLGLSRGRQVFVEAWMEEACDDDGKVDQGGDQASWRFATEGAGGGEDDGGVREGRDEAGEQGKREDEEAGEPCQDAIEAAQEDVATIDRLIFLLRQVWEGPITDELAVEVETILGYTDMAAGGGGLS